MSENAKNLGVFLSFKTREGSTSGIFDYSLHKKTIDMNTFISDDKIKVIESEDKKIIFSKNNVGNQLFRINCKENSFSFNFASNNCSSNISKNSINQLDKRLWYLINSDLTEFEDMNNEDYFLKENDIIKISHKKFIISKIIRKDKDKERKFSIFNLIPELTEFKDSEKLKKTEESKQFKKCEHCDKLMVRFCECDEFYHFDEIKNWIKERATQNIKDKVKNYYFKIFYCNEIYHKDSKCKDNEHQNNCNCRFCNTYYPLKFKVDKKGLESQGMKISDFSEDDIEEISDSHIVFTFYKIEKPKNKDYMIMESFEDIDRYNNNSNIIKSIHAIELNDKDEIIIGRNPENDITLSEKPISGRHALIKYNKETGKILLKNLSKIAGTLVLINEKEKNNCIKITEKPLFMQWNQTFIKIQVMSEEEYKKDEKNDNSEYPVKLKVETKKNKSS